MYKDRVLATHFVPHLTDRLDERQRLDVPNRAADLDNHHIHIRRQFADVGLDFIGYVRDYLNGLTWGKTYPGPELPADVVAKTRRKYLEAFKLLTGKDFE